MMRTRLPWAALAVVAISVAAGCGGQAGSPDPPAAAATTNYELRGTVVAVDVPRRILEIDHEAIPGFMPAMTMPYEVAEAGLLEGLTAGDRVRGTLRVDGRGYVITSLQKV
jgi:protein SCO1/2